MKVVTLSFEERVCTCADDHIEIAGLASETTGVAPSRDPNTSSTRGTRRDGNIETVADRSSSFTPTIVACCDDPP